ncbi:hypothetical protein H112_08085 [Trichophyton rubrum D6]|uniref:Uncharacterized protein n=4 Tax=Trichophyton TaxID=5550 RepID=A0A178EVH1_TRIRU|nr:uncharacterized protein TERG_00660 [Trichophyton rubrum CBS 118892]EZF10635.1 hypothetical protein H100_08113 [Trichophyton rubrum MR850]EZF37560.1 hypothetical protein H102_08069 [Trichophyton rubrum CBS 100081]EZF48167.1 hypothetical protein H103_08096 [Trichophyton rubrum CBS 288.86]EZF58830.1 hypothetical protein H104_08043 [Trichophyton rubrum CBS 289.86]EZF69421.1 hypothetical protein H105_08095 [Trichophyton soudanense CBS 452.61]EZF80075.1 hypothetical protein H110_08097 [Trichophy
MDIPDNGTPDLATVLKTLSSFSTPQPGQPQTASNLQPRDHPHIQSAHRIHTPTHTSLISSSSRQETGSVPSNKSSASPSVITAWPTALKYVMKTVAQNETVQYRIRRLIASQHEHEKTWWQGRQRLLAKQKARAGNQKKLDEVLRAVGGKVTDKPHESAPEEHELEIKRYDDKVYKASVEMSKALHLELKAMGIPFFAIKEELIRPASPDSGSKPENIDNSTERCITAEEAKALQLRMLDLLQDLCKE